MTRRQFSLLAALFFLSGAIGLGYEVVWIKILSLHFGHSAWSISTVIASFMGGLGIGSWIGGRIAHRVSRPLYVYAAAELGVLLLGLGSLFVLQRLDLWIEPLYQRFSENFTLIRFLLVFLLLLAPTSLMGATLPILVHGAAQGQAFQRSIGILYGINTLGAATGTVATGMFLFKWLGVQNTMGVILVLNAAVVAGALLLGRRAAPTAVVAREEAPAGSWKGTAPLLVIAFLSGLLALLAEVCWTRLLTPVLGSSTYAFTIILTVYLVGIGTGALLASHSFFHRLNRLTVVSALLLLVAFTVLFGLYYANALPGFFVALAEWNPAWFFLLQAMVAASLMILPTFGMGLLLPMTVCACRDLWPSAGRIVGAVYSVNTVGSILGSLLAGFVLLPYLGVRMSLVVASAIGIAAAVLITAGNPLVSLRQKGARIAAMAAAGLALLAFAPSLDSKRLQTGVFRSILAPLADDALSDANLLFLREGLSATVSVFRTPDSTYLNVNGKTDASTALDLETQYLIGHLPLFLAREPKLVNVVGYGSGATIRAVATHPVERIDVVELEPAILDADPYFSSVNDGVLTDPRVKLHVEDGRTFLRYTPELYDVIISEPSNPWIAGIGTLFSREYYEMTLSRLAPGGLFCQWIQRYEVSTETLNTMLQTMADVYPHVHVFLHAYDLICVAGKEPITGSPATYQALLSRPEVRANLERIHISDPFELFLGYIGTFPDDRDRYPSASRNTDDNLWLEFRAPLEMYKGVTSEMSPLPPESYLDRYEKIFFPGIDRREIALGIADAIIELRSFDPVRIDGLRAASEDPATQSMLIQAAATCRMRWQELEQRKDHIFRSAGLLREGADPHEVMALLEPHLATKPPQAGLHRFLGIACERRGDVDGALQHYRAALGIYREDYVSLLNAGTLLLERGQALEGEAALRECLRLSPAETPAWMNLFVVLRGTGREPEAMRLARDAERVLDPAEYQKLAEMMAR